MCFGTAAFHIDTFQCAILCQNEGHPDYPLSGDMIFCV